jgi:HEAT repeat protein
MPTSWPNSKKCSIAKSLAALWIAIPLCSSLALAQQHAPNALELRREIMRHSASIPFDSLLLGWQKRYDTSAVQPLLEVARATSQKLKGTEDSERYIALMGAAKLGGKGAAPMITPFLKDSSWMLRSGALRALTALGDPATAPAVLPLLQDPALVVRAEAVEAVRKLHPPGAADALVATLDERENYHGGKAQWVPQKALVALADLHAAQYAPRLKDLLDHNGDPELQTQTIATLESLTGRNLKQGAPLRDRVREWKLTLNRQ